MTHLPLIRQAPPKGMAENSPIKTLQFHLTPLILNLQVFGRAMLSSKCMEIIISRRGSDEYHTLSGKLK